MNFAFALFAIYMAFVLDTALVPLLGWGTFGPQIAVLVLFAIARRLEGRPGLFAAAAWGLWADGLSQCPLGINVVCSVIVVRCVQGMRGELDRSLLLAGVATWVAAFLIPATANAVELVISQEPFDVRRQLLSIAGPASTTAGMALVFHLLGSHLSGENRSGASDAAPRVSNRWRMLAE